MFFVPGVLDGFSCSDYSSTADGCPALPIGDPVLGSATGDVDSEMLGRCDDTEICNGITGIQFMECKTWKEAIPMVNIHTINITYNWRLSLLSSFPLSCPFPIGPVMDYHSRRFRSHSFSGDLHSCFPLEDKRVHHAYHGGSHRNDRALCAR